MDTSGKERTCHIHPARSIKTRPITAVVARTEFQGQTITARLARAATANPNRRTVSRQRRNQSSVYVTESPQIVEKFDHMTVLRDRTRDIDMGIDITLDNGWDTDLETEDEPEKFDGSSKRLYLEACKRLGVIPASYFLRHMNESHLEMKHHGLGPVSVKPLAIALVSNTVVQNLNLEDNWLGNVGGVCIADMLMENCFITHLNLSSNRLGTEFAKKFVEVLENNTTLTHVNFTGNDFDDMAAVHLAEAIMATEKLEELNLSHNQLSEKAGIALGPAIAENTSITNLDLSWNSIRRKGAQAIAKGLKENIGLIKVNLSWNGFDKDGCQALGDALKVNCTLQDLDISNNRITAEGSVLLGKGLAVNEGLKTLRIGQNPMQSAGCYAIMAAVKKNQNSQVKYVDFADITINADFGDILSQVRERTPDLRVHTGSDGVPVKPRSKVHPMIKLQNYITKHQLRLVDFFNRFDKDGSMSVTREEFSHGIHETGIHLTDEEILELIEDLDKDGDGEINYSELVVGQQDLSNFESVSSSSKNTHSAKLWKV